MATLESDNSGDINKKVEAAIEKALEMAGGIVESATKEMLTANGSVDTGLLRNSITYALGGEYPAIGQYSSQGGKVDEDGKPIEQKTGTYDMEAPQDRDGERTVYIGTNVEYAPYVELGHGQEPGRFVPALGRRLKASEVKAKPYLRPAAEGSKDKIKKAFQLAFKNL